MAKYRKKPIIVEAEIYKPGMEDGFDCGYETCVADDDYIGNCAECGHGKPYIQTLEGRHFISVGDYIITGIKGERYLCKPNIFEATYEPVED